LFVFAFATCLHAQSERVFSVPLQDLKMWSEHVVVSMTARITGHSRVHAERSDCEMHMGASVSAFSGQPAGWVLEPMNLCLELMPQTGIRTKADWETLGDDLVGKIIRVTGVPRVWPEHLKVNPKDAGSNPAHATELHPLMTLVRPDGDTLDFSSFVYAPSEFVGVKPKTAAGMLKETSVHVTKKNGMVEIDFESVPFLGNFAQVELSVIRNSITEVEGSHVMDGTAAVGSEQPVAVRLVTVAGSDIDDTIAKIKKGKKKIVSFDALVLFSLNPAALFEAAQQSHGNLVEVDTPIQLIVFGPVGGE